MVTPGAHSNHYEVLGLARSATAEQLERAYQFLAALYEDTAVATYSLLEPEELRDARARVRLAYEILRDPIQRRQYDAGLPPVEPHQERPRQAGPRPVFKMAAPRPAPAPASERRTPHPAPRPEGAAPVRPRILPEPVTGESLRKAREERGVSLQDIATATKIGVRFLEYIESDRHTRLPAVVYLRGFVQQYSRFIGLDPQRTTDSYLARLPKA